MNVQILLFARIAEAVGEREISLDLPEGSTVNAAWDQFESQYPQAQGLRAGLAFAVNENYIRSAEHIVRDGDTLAVIPPVSGG